MLLLLCLLQPLWSDGFNGVAVVFLFFFGSKGLVEWNSEFRILRVVVFSYGVAEFSVCLLGFADKENFSLIKDFNCSLRKK